MFNKYQGGNLLDIAPSIDNLREIYQAIQAATNIPKTKKFCARA